MAFQPCHSAPDIVFVCLDLTLKNCKKKLPNIFHQILLFYVQYIYGYIIITVCMDIQPLSNFFQQDEISGCHCFVPNIFLSHIRVM